MATSSSKATKKASLTDSKPAVNPLRIKLTPAQKRALRITWKQLKEGSSGAMVMERIFEKLISEKPAVKDVFYKAAFLGMFTRSDSGHKEIVTVRAHGKLLSKMLGDIVGNLDAKTAAKFEEIRDLGAKHAFMKESGFRPDIWEKFGEVAVDVIGNQDLIKQTPDAMGAWTLVLACATDEIRHGYEQQCRLNNRQASVEMP